MIGLKLRRIVTVFVLCIGFFALQSICSSAETSADIPDDAVEFNNHWYKCYESAMSWSDANSYCNEIGGHLVTITDKAEQDFVESLISDPSFESYWMGATVSGGKWSWITGEEFSYSNWYPNEPNGDSDGMYLQMFSTNRYVPGTWDDTWNSGDRGGGITTEGFICEWDKKGEKYTVTLKPNGGDVRPKKAIFNDGEKAGDKLPRAGRKGYKFIGWFSKAKKNEGTEIGEKYIIKKNLTVYAHWEKLKKEKSVVKKNKNKAKKNSKAPASGKKSAVSKSKKWSISEKAIVNRYAIPGIGTTSRIPQGLCLTDKYILISCYNCYKEDGLCGYSEILVLNRKGKFLTSLTIRLDEGTRITYDTYSHVGGLAYDPERRMIYIADSDEYYMYQDNDYVSNTIWKLPVSTIDTAVKSKKEIYNVVADKAFKADVKASCVTYYKGYVYVGEFSEKTKSHSRMMVYYYDEYEDRYIAANDKPIRIPLKTQGIAFRESGGSTYAYFSTSHGRTKVSKLIRMTANGDSYISSFSKSGKSCTMPNMSENICFDGNNLHMLFESGAYKYICEEKDGLFPLNSVLVFNINKLKFDKKAEL
ncbi:MAG: InlB B-repeat-containing protein [Mogibacterium sp.]|nr:InlB B-repeat-containing protein [Mogibacterium sp.]MBR0340854.1 InlB B-repeat-containing protein [Oscillospiraceae bacterium]